MVTTVLSRKAEQEMPLETATGVALVVEYDGTDYYGSQLQADKPTIQGELERALKSLTGERIRVTAASRTDTGVHARGQVVSFKTGVALPREAYIHGLNHRLPGDIAVRSAYCVPLSFNARRMAVSREYTYTILNSATRSPLLSRFSHRIAGTLDAEAMHRACQLLVGTHDFASFASEITDERGKSTIRHLYRAGVVRNGDTLVLTMVANAFVRHQVRSTAGALVQVGAGKMTVEELHTVLSARQPGLAGPTLPANGLCLVRVNYPCIIEELK